MSHAAEVAMRLALGILEYVLDRQTPEDRCLICRHVERVYGERAAIMEIQAEHARRVDK